MCERRSGKERREMFKCRQSPRELLECAVGTVICIAVVATVVWCLYWMTKTVLALFGAC